jgi:hypothetical protein
MTLTTYRYGLVLFGANYAPGYTSEPGHVIMVETLDEARDRLWFAARGNPRTVTGSGTHTLDTPAYGDCGDGAWVYRVKRNDPQFGEVLDLDGDRARHAYEWMERDEPSYMLEFGPVWGYRPAIARM